MVKKLSYITTALFIFVVGATTVSAAGVQHVASSYIATGLPESGSLAVLGSLLITGATLLRKKWAGNAK